MEIITLSILILLNLFLNQRIIRQVLIAIINKFNLPLKWYSESILCNKCFTFWYNLITIPLVFLLPNIIIYLLVVTSIVTIVELVEMAKDKWFNKLQDKINNIDGSNEE